MKYKFTQSIFMQTCHHPLVSSARSYSCKYLVDLFWWDEKFARSTQDSTNNQTLKRCAGTSAFHLLAAFGVAVVPSIWLMVWLLLVFWDERIASSSIRSCTHSCGDFSQGVQTHTRNLSPVCLQMSMIRSLARLLVPIREDFLCARYRPIPSSTPDKTSLSFQAC